MQPFLQVVIGQQSKFFPVGDIEGIGDQVRDPCVVGQVGNGDPQFFRKIRGEGDDLLKLLDGVPDHRHGLNGVVRARFQPFCPDRGEGHAGLDGNELDAGETAHQHPQGAIRELEHFHNAHQHPDG